jgi:hypothetical protein
LRGRAAPEFAADLGQGVGEVAAHDLVVLEVWITQVRQVCLAVVAGQVHQRVRGSGVGAAFTVNGHRERGQCRSRPAPCGGVDRRRLDHGLGAELGGALA